MYIKAQCVGPFLNKQASSAHWPGCLPWLWCVWFIVLIPGRARQEEKDTGELAS
jgi:hypothetical protein